MTRAGLTVFLIADWSVGYLSINLIGRLVVFTSSHNFVLQISLAYPTLYSLAHAVQCMHVTK